MKKLPRKYMVLFVIAFVGAFVFSVLLYLKFTHQLTPGPLSDAHPKGVSLGGVSSHAELATKCTHCHAPVHCLEDTRCQDCHKDIAKDRLDVSTLHGKLPGVSRCQNCHTEHKGPENELTVLAYQNVDHYLLAGFSLDLHTQDYDGSSFDCSSCHTKEGNFVETTDCVSCHAEKDHDYIAAHIETYGYACADCHDGKDRMLGGLNHAAFYPLIGGHQELACADCHQDGGYVGLTQTCYECHAEPEMHAGIFGTDCTRCHSEAAWAPAELKQHTFMIQHGDEEIESCESCHAGTYTEYPCGTCHEDADMVTAHADVETTDLHNCISCHPTGRGSQITAQIGKPDNPVSAGLSVNSTNTAVEPNLNQEQNQEQNQSKEAPKHK